MGKALPVRFAIGMMEMMEYCNPVMIGWNSETFIRRRKKQ